MKLIKKPVNLRDIGGYKGQENRKVKKNKLLRSGEIAKLNKKEEENLISNYKLKTIIDFRNEEEKNKLPDSKIENTDYYHIDIMGDINEKNSSYENLIKNVNINTTNKFMKSIYENFITNKNAIIGYQKFIEILLKQKNGSVLFHCHAGKDRTGFAALIILKILGVSEEDIFKDYLITNEMRKAENTNIIYNLKEKGYTKNELESISLALSVDKSYLQSSINKADEIYGSFDNYIIKALKVNKEMKEILTEKYLD